MQGLLKSPLVKRDLAEIWSYIAKDSPKNADKFIDLIDQKLELIAEFPSLGESCDELIKGLRSFPVGNYIVFYFPIQNGANIIRVIHASRDTSAIFN
ncbi:MAG: type II toxin-antitoxin system RelE/ParE family toxin [Pseudomonadota bacterium]